MWFRQKYNLPPNDPRFLSLTDIEIGWEREKSLFLESKLLRYCSSCDIQTYREECPLCGAGDLGGVTGDPVLDSLDENSNLDEIFGRELGEVGR